MAVARFERVEDDHPGGDADVLQVSVDALPVDAGALHDDELNLQLGHLFVLRHLSDSIDALQRQLADIDAYLMRAMQPYAWAHSLLQTIPGIDETAAALILIEIDDDMARFGAPERLACWAALSPGNHESAGKRKSGRTRHGNNAIRYILCECANAARMTKSTLPWRCPVLFQCYRPSS
ncbi:hypothetical protein THICB6_240011 [Thiomonas arsenitoxydans]|nr:hypothetical protein THICB6_240011 [Thiomonas arsenitoxydans]